MPAPDDAADLWPNTFSLSPADRTRMEAHADVLLEVAAGALRRANPSEVVDEAHAAYVAATVLIQRAALTRAELAALLSLLLTDAALAVGALRTDGDQLVVAPEHCRRTLWLMWRNARDGIERQLVGAPAAESGVGATH